MAHEDEPRGIDINSARGWQPKDPYKKLREQARKALAMRPDPAESMLELRPANRWVMPGSKQKPAAELFGPLWREGEVAILFGEKGVGKSIFAVQLADSIARGRPSLLKSSPPHAAEHWPSVARPERGVAALRGRGGSPPRSRKVLYLDFELTEQQFTERYSLPPLLPGKLPRRPNFKFTRAAINWDGRVPAAFKGDANRFMLHSVFYAIEEAEASVVIIDSISYLARNISSDTSCLNLMKTLRQWAVTFGISILVLAQAKPRRPVRGHSCPHSLSSPPYKGGVAAFRGQGGSLRPLSLSDIAGSRHIGEMADSVFAISRSTFGPEFRYIKHLASRSTAITPNADVLTYHLTGIDPQSAIRNPRSSASPLSTHHSPLIYLGPSNESDHLRDYAAEALAREHSEREHARRIARRSARDALIEGMMDGSYRRYLKGG